MLVPLEKVRTEFETSRAGIQSDYCTKFKIYLSEAKNVKMKAMQLAIFLVKILFTDTNILAFLEAKQSSSELNW